MQAAQLAYLQNLHQLLWIGLRIKGTPPKAVPVKAPTYTRPGGPSQQEQQRAQAHQARLARLRKFSPSHQPSAD
ncbi:hypothetical protein [Spirillospora sp. CA-294931]|uniref:hypothetical protein n=1 Tax=Spirillospora sp. CA-294931 TaxID=3240042 RepID=UPI003D8EBEF3